MTSLVSEREVGLCTALRNMGMLDSAYWGSWMAFDATMALVGALLILVFGGRPRGGRVAGRRRRRRRRGRFALQRRRGSRGGPPTQRRLQPPVSARPTDPSRCCTPTRTRPPPGMVLQFNYFLRNSPGLLLLLFWLFGLAMTSYSYCLSVFMKRAQVGGVFARLGRGGLGSTSLHPLTFECGGVGDSRPHPLAFERGGGEGTPQGRGTPPAPRLRRSGPAFDGQHAHPASCMATPARRPRN
jgi:hypothetical protein